MISIEQFKELKPFLENQNYDFSSDPASQHDMLPSIYVYIYI